MRGKMRKLWICEDEEQSLERIREEVQKILLSIRQTKDPALTMKVECFSNGQQLFRALPEDLELLIFLLDVEMPGPSGFEIARSLQDKYRDPLIIFLTSHEERMKEGYHVRAFRYVVKSRMEEELPEAILSAIDYQNQHQDMALILHHEGTICRIYTKEISWVEREKRKLSLHLTDGRVLTDPRGLTELLAEMDQDRFIKVSPGELINLDEISRMGTGELYLRDGTVRTISRRRVSEVKEALIRRWKNSQ